VRGDVYELPKPRNAVGHEQREERFAVIVGADDFAMLSTWLICPTSASAPPRQWRPEVTVGGKQTRVLVEQLTTVDPSRLGKHVGFLPLADMQDVDRALKLMLGLR
jgi:mRNA interferase MazF